jgi:hypothetical protein
MSRQRILPSVAFMTVLACLGVRAEAIHHSLSGLYDTSASTSLEGLIREFHFVNPHPYLTVEVSRNGRIQRWKMELDNLGELTAIGMTAKTFRAGDRVMVSGNPGRDDAKTLYVRKLDRPKDGFWYTQDDTEPLMGFAPK